jgi:hypothetical protein
MTNFLKSISFRFTPVLVAFFIAILALSGSGAFAQNKNYSSAKDGYWADASTWQAGNPAPNNITNKDLVEINHKVNTGNLKINNGGTLIIKSNGELKGEDLDLNGPDSKVIIEAGANLDFFNFFYDNSNSTESVIITNRDLVLVPLPVTLVYFKVKANSLSNATTLEWLTASEKNNAYFAVEKSLDGKTFAEAGRVTGRNAANGGMYAFEDKNTAGRAYYRLKQVDLDGTFTYSAIVVATADQKLAVHGKKVIFETAFTGKLHVLNVAGQKVSTIQLTNANTYDFPETLQGIYMLQLESNNQVTARKVRF